MKKILVLFLAALVGLAAAQDAEKTVTSGVIEVGPVLVAECPNGSISKQYILINDM
jgi:hypothetical protein